MADKRHPKGSTVMVTGCHAGHFICGADPKGCPTTERLATVVRHGRDNGGVYTRVRFEDGTEQDWLRTALRKVTS
jgi:hypothetical protein